MRFNKLDLNLLVALDALLTEESISRAAEKIHLSQSAMSNALARLREYFGDELLVQVGRKMELTSRAQGLKDAVRDILVRVDATVAARPLFVPSQANRLFRMLVSDYTMMTLMPHVLQLAYAQAPGVRFELRPQATQPQRVLERGEADLLIIPKDYCSPEHPSEQLFEEAFCCVLWNEGRLASGEMTEERYMTAGHVVVQPGDGIALEDWFMQRLGIKRQVEASTFSFLSPAHLVVGTHRVATMHVRLARQAARTLPVTIRPLPLAMPQMRQAVQWHKHRTSDPGLAWMRGLLKEAVAAMDRASAD
ncbi:LysR family transcriptional regulator [Trinickia caryophylli]|uniref:Transcriptional regulator, LysR family n=1 Tax=Trinickia caryophylli TaxID=28094 RepID=A0A1X7FP69_TRICW|nr:LysR family transcriptional regulator [Trinickia caryophylli]PMS09548.1 nodulation protein NfeD [Trinickia caryophylli]TRX14413.1 LysR family transcriptional regulator [Trinickia caryophylli]WQE14250.1 LysR family transcriptional regulator [Trinickia caryophylli]SMF56086.1 transcriptional regulator, LysR family [Trinickia caryophylli]GLU33239.1 transcriptional regulator [Trinickia caryophylli]